MVLLLALGVAACSSPDPTSQNADSESGDAATEDRGTNDPGEPGSDGDDEDSAARPDVEPQPFVPAGRVGDQAALDELIAELEQEIPAGLRSEVPWPDLRDPDPTKVQLAIFELWIWMAENNPEPALVAVMGAEDSPSREAMAGIFGEMKNDNELHRREQAPYQAFDHRAVTFESSGLPLWLGRDVPDDAVVVYYQDQSGPTTVRDRDSMEIIGINDTTGPRQWLSIMVPTEVGWLLYRDQLIEPNDSELEVPPLSPPSPDAPERKPEL